ncbi:hypothetical protein [Devosia sp. RR2S18]|uniref:hypothetical protein n=1 Tax=Devosia rhizosphaerae TaxID=3049774 RepID=UPI00253FD68F|nr:hypothetical protein [Devosia sp. RR2S18]WIJ24456.1 hypothetical protein QOV41_15740 [Devosia sp. RR2S18]
MSDSGYYSVQACKPAEGAIELSECIQVKASCPVKAGEVALREKLALHGKQLRAKVWFLREDFTPQSVLLYAAERS